MATTVAKKAAPAKKAPAKKAVPAKAAAAKKAASTGAASRGAAKRNGDGAGSAQPPARRLQSDTVVSMPLRQVHPSPRQPRRFDRNLEGLAASIERHGVQSPLLVTPHPEIRGDVMLVAGHRRLAASKLAGKTHVPVLLRDTPAGAELLEAHLVENMQREDLDAMEKAEAFQALSELGRSVSEIAERLGVSNGMVSKHLAFWKLPVAVQDMLESGPNGKPQLTAEAGYELSKLADDTPRLNAALNQLRNGCSFDQLVRFVKGQVDEMKLAKLRVKVAGDLERKGVPLVPWPRNGFWSNRAERPLAGQQDAYGAIAVTVADHKKAACHAASVSDSGKVVWVCTQPDVHKMEQMALAGDGESPAAAPGMSSSAGPSSTSNGDGTLPPGAVAFPPDAEVPPAPKPKPVTGNLAKLTKVAVECLAVLDQAYADYQAERTPKSHDALVEALATQLEKAGIPPRDGHYESWPEAIDRLRGFVAELQAGGRPTPKTPAECQAERIAEAEREREAEAARAEARDAAHAKRVEFVKGLFRSGKGVQLDAAADLLATAVVAEMLNQFAVADEEAVVDVAEMLGISHTVDGNDWNTVNFASAAVTCWLHEIPGSARVVQLGAATVAAGMEVSLRYRHLGSWQMANAYFEFLEAHRYKRTDFDVEVLDGMRSDWDEFLDNAEATTNNGAPAEGGVTG